ncbi:hypothetical protein D3C72_2327060 [compost metagenome]
MQHKGFAAPRRELGKDAFQVLQALLLLGVIQRIGVGVEPCLFVRSCLLINRGMAHALAAPVVVEQVARDLKQKRARLFHL